jgi:Putative citrate transport
MPRRKQRPGILRLLLASSVIGTKRTIYSRSSISLGHATGKLIPANRRGVKLRPSLVREHASSPTVGMPSFIGYMLWSGAILLPLFELVTWIWFL